MVGIVDDIGLTGRTGLAGNCEVMVAGVVARSVIDTIGMRFHIVSVRTAEGTILTVGRVDQPAIRALMIMLWDSGHDVLAMSTTPMGPGPSPARSRRSDQAEVASHLDRFLPGRDAEPAVEALVVGLDGVHGEEQGASDLPLGGRSR